LKKFLRDAKNSMKGFSDVQVLVREATSNDPWCAPGSLLKRIAMEAENPAQYHDMFKTLWKRLSDFPHLMHVQKSLALIYYLLKISSDRFVADVRLRSDIIKKLCYYKYFKDGIEIGEEVRIKAQVIVMLLDDLVLLTKERDEARNGRISGFDSRASGSIRLDSIRQVDKYASMSDSPRSIRFASFSEEKERETMALAVVKPVAMEDDDDFFMFDEIMAPEPKVMYKPLVGKIEMDDVIEELGVRQNEEKQNVVVFQNEEKVKKGVFLGSDEVPNDLWDFNDFTDIRSSRSDREREEFLEFQEYKRQQSLKLKDMEPIYKMEFDPSMQLPMYTGHSSAMVPYNMQPQMMSYGQPIYGQPVYGQAMVPYVPVYLHYGQQEQQLHWN